MKIDKKLNIGPLDNNSWFESCFSKLSIFNRQIVLVILYGYFLVGVVLIFFLWKDHSKRVLSLTSPEKELQGFPLILKTVFSN